MCAIYLMVIYIKAFVEIACDINSEVIILMIISVRDDDIYEQNVGDDAII